MKQSKKELVLVIYIYHTFTSEWQYFLLVLCMHTYIYTHTPGGGCYLCSIPLNHNWIIKHLQSLQTVSSIILQNVLFELCLMEEGILGAFRPLSMVLKCKKISETWSYSVESLVCVIIICNLLHNEAFSWYFNHCFDVIVNYIYFTHSFMWLLSISNITTSTFLYWIPN